MTEEKSPKSKGRPGDRIIHKSRKAGVRLRLVPRMPSILIFLKDLIVHTPFLQMFILLIFVWLGLSAGVYFADHNADGTSIITYGDALYIGIAGFSTSGIAAMPVTPVGKVFCALVMVLGSAIFFGAIVSAVTVYFMRPLQRPKKQLISTIEYNLGQLEGLSVEELELLKETTANLINIQIKQNKTKTKEPDSK
jgi:voltage-gated potassium channel